MPNKPGSLCKLVNHSLIHHKRLFHLLNPCRSLMHSLCRITVLPSKADLNSPDYGAPFIQLTVTKPDNDKLHVAASNSTDPHFLSRSSVALVSKKRDRSTSQTRTELFRTRSSRSERAKISGVIFQETSHHKPNNWPNKLGWSKNTFGFCFQLMKGSSTNLTPPPP